MTAAKPTQTALVVLALCFALAVIGRGFGESFTVFLLPISQTFGWDRAEVVSIYSMAALIGGLSAPVIGRLFDHSGPRTVFALGMALIGGAFLVASAAERLWQFQLSLGLCVGIGVACLGNVSHSILLGRWFGARLTTAMAVIYSATGAGVLAILPLSQVLIERVGWPSAYQIFGTAMLVLLVPLLLLPWKRFAAGSAKVTRTAAADLPGEDWTVAAAMRHSAFWGLFSTFFFTAVGMYAISAQIVAYLVDAGFAPLQAATAWGFSGVVMLAGMLSVTWLDSVIGRRRSVLVSYAFSILGIVLLRLLRIYPNLPLLAGFVICFGATLGSRGPLITATAMRIFRGRRVGTIFGAISIGSGLGAAIGSWSGGLIHDLTGSYDPLLLFALINVVLGMIPFLSMRTLRE
jgi:predicted MFS family arabinose efflux permease